MARLIRARLGDGVEVWVSAEQADKLFGERSSELLPKLIQDIRQILSAHGARSIKVVERGAWTVLIGKGIPPTRFGHVENEAKSLERRVRKRFEVGYFHRVNMLMSSSPIEPFEIAVYEVLGSLPQNPYPVLAKCCKKLSATQQVACERLSHRHVGLPLVGVEEPPQEVVVDLEEGSYALRLSEVVSFNPEKRGHREFLKRLINNAVKKRLRAAGYEVRGLTAFLKDDVSNHPLVSVRPGIEFQTTVFSDGYVALSISPRHDLTSKKSLWQELGESREKALEQRSELVGKRVRPTYAAKTCLIADVVDAYPNTPLEELGGASLLQAYEEQGVDASAVSEEEPLLRVYSPAGSWFEAPSMVKRVYTLADLKQMGISKQLSKILHVPPTEWERYLSQYADLLSRLDLGFAEVELVKRFQEVELL